MSNTHGVFGLLRQRRGNFKAKTRFWLGRLPKAIPGEKLFVFAELSNGDWADYEVPVGELTSYKAEKFGKKWRHSRLEIDKEEANSLAERLNAIVPPPPDFHSLGHLG